MTSNIEVYKAKMDCLILEQEEVDNLLNLLKTDPNAIVTVPAEYDLLIERARSSNDYSLVIKELELKTLEFSHIQPLIQERIKLLEELLLEEYILSIEISELNSKNDIILLLREIHYNIEKQEEIIKILDRLLV